MPNRTAHTAAAALTAAALILGATALAAAAQDRPGPPGLAGASLRAGWITPQGHRMTALQLDLQPGWKTYWRAPGDAGIPPRFDWSGSRNLGAVTVHWPAPEVIDSGGIHTLGFHDRLLLPVEITPTVPGQPVELALAVDFGLCREVCVPARATLAAPGAAAIPDPEIEAALAAMPRLQAVQPACDATPIADGVRLRARLPGAALPRLAAGATPQAAMELSGGEAEARVWVSAPEVAADAGGVSITADFVPPQAAPFDLDLDGLRLTLIGEDDAVETRGCAD